LQTKVAIEFHEAFGAASVMNIPLTICVCLLGVCLLSRPAFSDCTATNSGSKDQCTCTSSNCSLGTQCYCSTQDGKSNTPICECRGARGNLFTPLPASASNLNARLLLEPADHKATR